MDLWGVRRHDWEGGTKLVEQKKKQRGSCRSFYFNENFYESFKLDNIT